ncbi:MAG TPA: C4-dicarboxylate ABC transporter permease [Gemmatimonadetes bacterium]|nr:C4-dicarboxylate ABC transporter permease [Gemmatimonadota bacterium]HCK59823.1 C4-dicarboxylate ABC transporter permease [Gemmatimonadota bacterium]HCW77934.1 C4-dicarboxylate ABC transporter permease [Gemmatimonadota bacterium]
MSLLAIGLLLLALVVAGIPIAIALGIAAVVAMLTGPDGSGSLPNTALVMFDGATSFPLIAIPLFILAGAIMNASGISRRLIAFASAVVGFIRGGLSMVTISASLFFAEISGSAVADVAALGSILIPAMREKGYSKAFAAAVTSSSATLAVIIPPSIPMIIYGVMSGSSIVELFVAGIVPGVLGGGLMMLVAYFLARKHDFPREQEFQLGRVWRTFRDAGWALTLPLIILGGIFSGWVTATEGAGLAVVASVLIGGLVYRELDLALLKRAMLEGGQQTAVVMLLVAASALLGDYLTEVRVPQQVAEGIMGMTQDRWAILLLLNVFFLGIGLFLHSAAAIILVVPIVMPLVQAAGIDPVHFGLIVTLNLGIGQQTPPVASVLVTACSVAKADVWEVSKVNLWFIGVLVSMLLLVTYLPIVPMALVELFYR